MFVKTFATLSGKVRRPLKIYIFLISIKYWLVLQFVNFATVNILAVTNMKKIDLNFDKILEAITGKECASFSNHKK